MPLISAQEHAIAALETYKTLYPQALARRMAAKLGFSVPDEAHKPLIEAVLKLMAADRVDFTLFWRTLSHWARACDMHDTRVRDLFLNREAIDAWLLQYAEQLAPGQRGLAADLMLKTNPKFVLRNHLGELAIRAARGKNFTMVADLLKVLERPCDEHPEHAHWAGFPPDWASSIEISCSS